MGSELREPPSDEGVPQDVADQLVRGRIAVAAGSAIVAFGAALFRGGWRTSPLLVGALVLALSTVAFAVSTRHFRPRARRGRSAAIVVLLAIDALVLFVVASAAGGAGIAALLAVLLVASLVVHVRALVRIAAAPPAAPASGAFPPQAVPMVTAEAEADAVGARARELAGIVRARAEALRLAAEEAGVGELLGHDLDVLVRQAEECQRVLRDLEQALAARLAPTARLPPRVAADDAPPRSAPDSEPCPSASTPLPS